MAEETIIDLQGDQHFMGEALRQARRAYEAGEVVFVLPRASGSFGNLLKFL